MYGVTDVLSFCLMSLREQTRTAIVNVNHLLSNESSPRALYSVHHCTARSFCVQYLCAHLLAGMWRCLSGCGSDCARRARRRRSRRTRSSSSPSASPTDRTRTSSRCALGPRPPATAIVRETQSLGLSFLN